MYMYRIEIELSDQLAYLIVISESDEQAFTYAEDLLTRHFVAKPLVKQLSIVEKKRVQPGSGYLIETRSSQ